MIYYVRHGETIANTKDLLCGQNESPLTQKGIKQAQQTALSLMNVEFEACYCSPYERAVDTLKEILKYHPNLSITIDDRLKERNYGELDNKDKSLIDEEEYNKRYIFGYTPNIKGLESIEDLYKRAESFLDEVISKHGDKNILIVAHGGIGRLVKCYFNGIPKDGNLSHLSTGNGEILEFENKKFKTINR